MALLTQSEALEIINGFREKAVSRQALSKLNRNAWNFFKGSSVDTNKMSFWEYATGARKPSRLIADNNKNSDKPIKPNELNCFMNETKAMSKGQHLAMSMIPLLFRKAANILYQYVR